MENVGAVQKEVFWTTLHFYFSAEGIKIFIYAVGVVPKVDFGQPQSKITLPKAQ
jgi:hypothetical protein